MIKISVTGPESSGKTELSVWLSERLQGVILIPEYARDYLEKRPLGYEYTEREIEFFAEKTHDQIVEVLSNKSHSALICDTDFYVLDIWDRVVFGQINKRIAELKWEHRFDIYLLCRPDIPWHYDPLRENEYDRDVLFEKYEESLKADQAFYFIVEGSGEERNRTALQELMGLFPTLRLKDESQNRE